MLPSVQAFVIEQKFCVPTVYPLKTQAVMETSTGLPLVDSHSRNTDSCTGTYSSAKVISAGSNPPKTTITETEQPDGKCQGGGGCARPLGSDPFAT